MACLVLVGLCSFIGWQAASQPVLAQGWPMDPCSRPAVGSVVPEPPDLRSHNGVLKLDLAIRNVRQKDGTSHYCYLLPDGRQSPTLRVRPGDRLVLHLKNELTADQPGSTGLQPLLNKSICTAKPAKESNPCDSGVMSATSTNIHFHGLTVPPVCHQDDVLKTSIQPGDKAFEYSFQIPRDEPPGLYWYHPHMHGFSSEQVQGGASGALIVEGIEHAMPEVAGLPERVLVIRDQELLNPKAMPARSEPVMSRSLVESDGDAVNNGTGFGKPSKDLSVNFVPVAYPDYKPAVIRMKPDERQLWRVLNASSVTYLNLALLVQRQPQKLGIVAVDGVPELSDGKSQPSALWVDQVGIPPGARVEFIMNGPPSGKAGLLVTRTVDTGPVGENDPNRALAMVVADAGATAPASILPKAHEVLSAVSLPPLRQVTPVRTRRLFFSEKPSDPNDPNSPTEFYLTVDGQKPKVFDPHDGMPNIEVKQGDVEDWIIENRSSELHAFHIHQIHFLVMDVSGRPIAEPFMRDTVNVPYFKQQMLSYPSVRLRMDFRDPNTVGTFVYHCHLLEHEDGGMMGTIRVLPRHAKSQRSPTGSNATPG
ncbi:copper oxidase [Paraburkholderia fungorum]|uniref:Copper oxidase n=2 Tax=Paraburkholderia fungorum TaxID=134537 RepID=A0A420FSZ8_9BURK|nr:copper oxidase [Paraburkholderia fungorum]